MSKLNVGNRSKAADAEALKNLEEAISGNQEIVVENGAKYIVEKSAFGPTIKTRIA